MYTKIDHTINGEIKRLLRDFMWPTVLYRTICICIYGFGYDDRSGSLQNIIVPHEAIPFGTVTQLLELKHLTAPQTCDGVGSPCPCACPCAMWQYGMPCPGPSLSRPRVTRGRDSGVWRRGWVPGSLGRPRLGLKSAHPLLLALLRALEALGLPGPARSLPLLARLVRVGVEG